MPIFYICKSEYMFDSLRINFLKVQVIKLILSGIFAFLYNPDAFS